MLRFTIYDSETFISAPLNDRGVYIGLAGYDYRIWLFALKNRVHFDYFDLLPHTHVR